MLMLFIGGPWNGQVAAIEDVRAREIIKWWEKCVH